ncbi:MAG: pseudouridine synthase, partial [Candidatus Latescibacterota bacterium]
VRLNRFLSQAGVASRRKADEMVLKGRVRINGEVARIGQMVDPDRDEVTVDGRPVRPKDRFSYFLLHKPVGVLVSHNDPFGRPTIFDLGLPRDLYYVGRLDRDAEGLLLLTDDGELAHRLAHPRYEVEKVYRVWVEGKPGDEALRLLRNGVPLEDGKTAPAEVRIVGQWRKGAVLEIIVHEGRKRQVKRMCSYVGHPARRLLRVRFAGLSLDGLKPGGWRPLDEGEVRKLKASVGL